MEKDDIFNKVFFMPGDKVTLKQEIPNKPIMIVVKKKTLTIKPKDGEKNDFLIGILCIWFTETGELQEYVFNTKDLKKL